VTAVLLAFLVVVLPFPKLAEQTGEDTEDAPGDTLENQPETPSEEEPFLTPYYQAGDSTSEESSEDGCFPSDGCCGTALDIFRWVSLIEVSHRPDPFREGGVRSELGDDGNPFGLSASAGISRLDDGKGLVAGARLLTPCPAGIELLYHRADGADGGEFSLLYAGVPFQLAFGSPLQVALGPQLVFPKEEGRYTLTGVGLGLAAGCLFLDDAGVSIDYRLAWVNGLPLQRGELRLSWYMLPAELWAGYGFLRNSLGEVLSGPSAGVGLLL
jgi:hypothetical protein